AVNRERIDRVVFGVRAGLGPVEDIIGREMNEGGADVAASIGQGRRTVAVDSKGHVGLALGLIDRGVGGSVDDEVRSHVRYIAPDRVWSGKVELVALDKVDRGPSRPGT